MNYLVLGEGFAYASVIPIQVSNVDSYQLLF